MEVVYVKEYALYHLNVVGLHPFKKYILSRIRLALYLMLMFGPTCVLIYNTISNIESIENSIVLMPPAQQVIFKVICAMYFEKKVFHLLQKTDHFWKDDMFGDELKNLLDTKNNIFFKTFNVYKIMLVVTIIGFDIKIVLSDYKILEKSLDAQDYFAMTADVIYLSLLGYSMIVYDTLFFTLVNCAAMQMIKIQYGLEHLSVDKSSEDTYKDFCSLVEYHNYILRFIIDMNDIFSIQLLNHFCTTSCCICIGIFMLNIDGFPPPMEKLTYYASYLLCHHYQLFIYCAYGQILLNEMELVREAVYNSGWYVKYQPKLAKGMLYVVTMADLPNKLTIGGFWELNFRTFMSVVKSSFSFNAFMQSVYRNEQSELHRLKR